MMTDDELAAEVARGAGAILMTLRDSGLLVGRALGEAGDAIANRFIVDALGAHRPDDAILSEETADSGERLTHARVWVVDPLDGTREFAEGRCDWAVHVALSIDGVPCAGAVALPALGIVHRADQRAACAEPGTRPRLVVSRSRPAVETARVAERLQADIVPMGSAGAKAMAVVRGEADIYLHSGGQYEWDSCAPVAVAAAAGLHVSRIDGSPLDYNRPDPWLPDLLVCRPELADAILRETCRPVIG